MNEHLTLIRDFLLRDDRAGLTEFNIRIGTLGVTVCSAGGDLFDQAVKKYEEFLYPEKFRTEVVIHDLDKVKEADAVKQSFEEYRDLVTYAEGSVFYVYRWDFYGIIDLQQLSGKFIYFYGETFMSYESIIRIFYSILTVVNQGFLMHSSSLIHKGKGYLFFGVSGSGKSTVVKLSESDTCLSDELSMIIKVEGNYIVSGTPFHGELPIYTNRQAELRNLFILKKSPDDFFRKLGDVEAYTSIMRNILFFCDDWGLKQLIFNTTIDLVKHTGVYEMNFTKTNKFWEIIDHGL